MTSLHKLIQYGKNGGSVMTRGPPSFTASAGGGLNQAANVYATITSTQSSDVYKSNTPNNFIAVLPYALHLAGYEVGLVSLRYTPKIEAIDNENGTPPDGGGSGQDEVPIPDLTKPVTHSADEMQGDEPSELSQLSPPLQPATKFRIPGKLFPNLKPSIITKFTYTKLDMDLNTFFIQFNKQALDKTFPLQFIQMMIHFKPLEICCQLFAKPIRENVFVQIPSEVAAVFKFNRYRFSAGQYCSYENTTQDDFSAIPLNSSFDFLTEEFPTMENVLTLWEGYEEIYPFRKDVALGDGKTFRHFFDRLNASMAQAHWKLAITFPDDNVVADTPNTRAQLEFIGNAQEYIVLPSEITEVLGFTQDQFSSGVYRSEFDINTKAYEAIEDMVYMYVRSFLIFSHKFAMNEPLEIEVSYVVHEINLTLARNLYSDTRGIQFVLQDGILSVPSLREDMKIQLPVLVNKYFGFDDDFVFVQGTRAPVREELLQEEELEEMIEEGQDVIYPEPSEPAKRLLVLCNLIQNSFYGSRIFPLLRMTDLPVAPPLLASETAITMTDKSKEIADKTYKIEVRQNFLPILYLPLDQSSFQIVRIHLVTEYGQLLPVDDQSTTVAELHFKKCFE